MWLFFTLLTAFLWGVGQVFTKKGLDETSPLFNNMLGSLVILMVGGTYALYNGVNFDLIPKIFPLGLIISASMLYYYYAISKGQVSLTGTILAAYPLATIVLSLYFLHEQPSNFQKLAIILVLSGSIILALGENIRALRNFKIDTWFWWALSGALIIGIGDFLAKVAMNQSDVNTYILTYGITFFLVALTSLVFDKDGRKIPKLQFKNFLPTIVGVMMVETGLVTYYIAISMGLVSVVTPISSIYVAITAILALIFLKEKIKKLQIAGIALSVMGIILLGIV